MVGWLGWQNWVGWSDDLERYILNLKVCLTNVILLIRLGDLRILVDLINVKIVLINHILGCISEASGCFWDLPKGFLGGLGGSRDGRAGRHR